jgi:AcrR family transcriptional regulator
MTSPESINKSGQLLGRKGLNTRLRVIEATERLLVQSRGLPPPLSMIAPEAKISPPTFYLYFSDVPDAIYATVERISERLRPVVDLLSQPWDVARAYDHANDFIDAFFGYWSANSAVLRARNHLADEGNERFVQARLHSIDELSAQLATKLRPALVQGKVVATPDELARTMLISIERIATITVLNLYPTKARDLRASKQALAFQLSLLVDAASLASD